MNLPRDRHDGQRCAPSVPAPVRCADRSCAMSPVMRLLQETPEPEPEAEGGGIDWASVLFFGGAVLGFLNWLTMSFLRERTSLVYFSSVPTDPIDQAQVVTLVGAVGMMMGTLAMIIMAVFCHGPPSSELMYSAVRLPNALFAAEGRPGLTPRPRRRPACTSCSSLTKSSASSRAPTTS